MHGCVHVRKPYRGVCTCASVQLIGNENWKPYIFVTIDNPASRRSVTVLWYTFLLSGNTASRAKILVHPACEWAFKSRIPSTKFAYPRFPPLLFESNPGSRDESTLRTNENKWGKTQTKKQSVKSHLYKFLFIYFFKLFFVIAFGQATSLSRKPAD